jgi:hypothetical protein
MLSARTGNKKINGRFPREPAFSVLQPSLFQFLQNPSFSSCNTILGWLFFPRDITRWRFILYFLFCWKLLRSISEIAAQRFKFPAHHF